MELSKVIATRKSTRKYKEDQISREELDAILLAGSSAPVGMGAYNDLHYTVIQNKELLLKISKACAKAIGNPDLNLLYGVPTLVILSSVKELRFPGAEYANAGCIIENMLLTATDLNVGSVYLMGFLLGLQTEPELITQLDLPDGFSPVSAVGLGYPLESFTEKKMKMKIDVNIIS